VTIRRIVITSTSVLSHYSLCDTVKGKTIDISKTFSQWCGCGVDSGATVVMALCKQMIICC